MGDLLAPTARYFRQTLADARLAKVRDRWSGSAFRCHPHGVFRRGILFADHWNVNDYCHAEVYVDPKARVVEGCNASAAYGDPWPKPSVGTTVTVYSSGRWEGPDGPWRQAIVEVLAELRREIDLHAIGQRAIRADESRRAKAAQAQRDATLLAGWHSRVTP